ncbi:MAG: response regulator transcription factor [Firmicutes bacterium]|nr:response regulator transcription factor [[Eubacterium] siraeum]MCM1487996.1 response regulator transcription factor [Bacillota bacterium]
MIFCVEDDSSIRELMIYALNASGFEAKGFSDGEALFGALKTETPWIIMLDIMLPGEDGISVLKHLRGNPSTAGIPVIMATAKGTEYDKVIGLDSGADDYLAKPFGMMEMVSRVKAVLRRTRPVAKPSVYSVGGITLNTSEHRVTVDERQVQLTLKEYALLLLFMERPEIAFTREQLLQSVWGSDFVGETRTVDVHIGTLRTKLGEWGELIETVRGVGYRMRTEL